MRRGDDRHDHSREHLTDVHTWRLRASAGDGYVVFAWDYPGNTLLEVKILRSAGAAVPPADGMAQGQVEIYRGTNGSFRDTDVRNEHTYLYTVYARHLGEQEWTRWAEYEQRTGAVPPLGAGARPGAEQRPGAGRRPSAKQSGERHTVSRIVRRWFGRKTVPAVAVALLCVATLAAAAPRAAATSSSGKPAVSPSSGAAAKASAAAQASAAATQVAAADPRVAAVLNGMTSPQVRVVRWPASPQVGATVYFSWPAAEARDVAAVWPLVKTAGRGQLPTPPYATVQRRLRIGDLTALRVDVLQGRVIQVAPMNGVTQFQLREETWPPFSWIPRFNERPWVIVPVFVVVGLVVVARAWRRSRAWNRRLPSMTRHDRQFIGRLLMILFLLASLVWQVWGAVNAASAPAVGSAGVNAGALAALPLLLIPPAIFVAAAVLEFSPAPHRAAWALVAVLAGATSAYNLATAVTGTTTNLNLTYYILLGILCVLAAPRSFSAGRMGWSRDRLPRYS